MKTIYIDKIDDILNDEPLCLALGYFDGIHLGHVQLINECNKISKDRRLTPSLLTFDPAPSSVLRPSLYLGNINSLDDKLKIIEALGIEKVYILKFSNELASLDKEIFIEKILKKLNAKYIVCGFDFTFGFKGLGNSELLQKYFDISVINEYKIDGEKVSTSRIKKCLLDGDIKTCNKLLGYNFIISGNVIHGLKNGRKIGYPTANIDHNGYFLPKNGVYACYTYIDGKKYKSMVNVGNHPTISKLDNAIIESYILNFNEEIYDKNIKIEFIDFIRDEKNFENIINLKNRLDIDTEIVDKLL